MSSFVQNCVWVVERSERYVPGSDILGIFKERENAVAFAAEHVAKQGEGWKQSANSELKWEGVADLIEVCSYCLKDS